MKPDVMAGHSLGEITALVAARALSSEDGLRLVAERGRLMQEAADETGDGGMTAVRARAGNREAIAEVAAATGVAIANDNAPDQLVLSGALSALDDAEAQLKERGVRGKRLPVAGAFHSPLMSRRWTFRTIVNAVEFSEPAVPVYSCVTAEPFDDIPERLVQAITKPVRWLDVMPSARGARDHQFRGDRPRPRPDQPRVEVARIGGRPCVARTSFGRTRGRPCAMPPHPTPQRRRRRPPCRGTAKSARPPWRPWPWRYPSA